jgi:hypothetical protein
VLTHFRSLQSPDAKISLIAVFSYLLISQLSGADTAILSLHICTTIQYIHSISPSTVQFQALYYQTYKSILAPIKSVYGCIHSTSQSQPRRYTPPMQQKMARCDGIFLNKMFFVRLSIFLTIAVSC